MTSNRLVDNYEDVSHYKIISFGGIANILVGVTIFSLFLSIFFFTYAAKIENKILKIQIKNLVDNFVGDLDSLNLDESRKTQLIELIDENMKTDMSDSDKEVNDINKSLVKKSIKIFGGLTIVSIAIVTIMYFTVKIEIGNILLSNLIVIVFVALLEIFFLNFIAKRYRSLDTNTVKKNIVEELLKFEEIK